MRINAFPSTTTPSSSDMFVIDGASGTKSITLDALKNVIAQGVGGSGGTGSGSGGSSYVTSSGTSGLWRYRLWSDGLKECWIPGAEVTGSESGSIISLNYNYPVTFDSTPACVAIGGIAGDLNSYTTLIGVAQTYVNIHIKSTSSGSKTCVISAYAIGY